MAGAIGLVRGAWCIIANQAYTACLREPLIAAVRWTEVGIAVSFGFLVFSLMKMSLVTHSLCKQFVCMC